jgi:hypothetical protein
MKDILLALATVLSVCMFYLVFRLGKSTQKRFLVIFPLGDLHSNDPKIKSLSYLISIGFGFLILIVLILDFKFQAFK